MVVSHRGCLINANTKITVDWITNPKFTWNIIAVGWILNGSSNWGKKGGMEWAMISSDTNCREWLFSLNVCVSVSVCCFIFFLLFRHTRPGQELPIVHESIFWFVRKKMPPVTLKKKKKTVRGGGGEGIKKSSLQHLVQHLVELEEKKVRTAAREGTAAAKQKI